MRQIKRHIFENIGPKFKNQPLLYYAEDLTDFIENKDKVQRTRTPNSTWIYTDTYVVIIEDLIVEGFFYLDEKEKTDIADWLPHTELRDKKTYLIITLSLISLTKSAWDKLQTKKPNYYCTVYILVGPRDKKSPLSFTQIIDINFFDTPQKKRKIPKYEELNREEEFAWGKLQPIPIRNK